MEGERIALSSFYGHTTGHMEACDTKTWFPGLGVAFDPDRRMFHRIYEIAHVLYRYSYLCEYQLKNEI